MGTGKSEEYAVIENGLTDHFIWCKEEQNAPFAQRNVK